MNASPEPLTTAVQINLFCDDVESVALFYRALGFPEVFRAPVDGNAEHLEVEAAGTRIGLTSAAAANRIAHLGVSVQPVPSTELVLWCGDVDTAFEAALAAGATAVSEPRDSPDGRIRFGWVRDPEGHQVKFVAFL